MCTLDGKFIKIGSKKCYWAQNEAISKLVKTGPFVSLAGEIISEFDLAESVGYHSRAAPASSELFRGSASSKFN